MILHVAHLGNTSLPQSVVEVVRHEALVQAQVPLECLKRGEQVEDGSEKWISDVQIVQMEIRSIKIKTHPPAAQRPQGAGMSRSSRPYGCH